jgi:hypothetical protein
MYELVQITAQYSNAVLLAVMPYVSDFAKTLDLPIPQPITAEQVQSFRCSPRTDLLGGRVMLTNGHEFSFAYGRVGLYRSPNSFYSLQDPGRIPEFYGPVKLSEKQALQIARDAISDLGYSNAVLSANGRPEITEPPRNGKNRVPRYRIKWFEPTPAPGGRPRPSADIEVDSATGRIQMLSLFNTNTWRPAPKVDVHPPVIGKGPQTTYRGGRKIMPTNPAYSNAFLMAIMPEISEYARKAGFPLQPPVTTDQLDRQRTASGLVEGMPFAQVYLKTGECFQYRHGQIVGAYSKDVFQRPDATENSPDDFLGEVKLSSSEATALVRRTIRQLGYSEKNMPFAKEPDIAKPTKRGTNFFARYFFHWRDENEGTILIWAEVDASAKSMKGLYINTYPNKALWRDPPKIEVSPDEVMPDENNP